MVQGTGIRKPEYAFARYPYTYGISNNASSCANSAYRATLNPKPFVLVFVGLVQGSGLCLEALSLWIQGLGGFWAMEGLGFRVSEP